MSLWGTVLSGLKGLGASSQQGASLIGTDLQIFNTAMTSTTQTIRDLKTGSLTPEEALTTIDLQLKAIAIVYPPAELLESYVETARTVAIVAEDLGLLKTEHGLYYKPGSGINPNSGAPLFT